MTYRKVRFIFNSINFSHIFKHKLFKNDFICTGSSVINRAMPFFLLPVMTRYLTPSGYGVLVNFNVLLTENVHIF